MDKIIIEDLEVYAYHGVSPEEKRLGQMFLVSLVIGADLEPAAAGGRIGQTIDYGTVCDTVKAILQANSRDLIETAAMQVLEGLFRAFAPARSVRILLKKPWAPMGHHLRYAAVELERRREDRDAW